MDNLLQVLLQEQINKRGLSIREAGRQVGVAHTTIIRILGGDSADIDTLIAICKWLDVPPSIILDSNQDGPDGLSAKISTVLELYPQFSEVFAEAMSRLARGEIDSSVVADLIAYTSYRLRQEEKDERVNVERGEGDFEGN